MEGDHDLRSWYSARRPLFVDLVGDFCGRELFLLDGDSLLRHILNDDNLDFQENLPILHVVYLFESFLAALRKRNLNFHVIFFNENKHVSLPFATQPEDAPKYMLVRSCLILHLSNATDGLLYTFAGLDDECFREHLKVHQPYFVMVHDGSTTKGAGTMGAAAKLLLSNMLRLLRHGLHLALVNEVVFKDSKVLTNVIDSQSAQTFTAGSGTDTIGTRSAADLRRHFGFDTASKIPSIRFEPVNGITSLRENILVCILRDRPDIMPFEIAPALLLHLVLLRSMSLSERAKVAHEILCFDDSTKRIEFNSAICRIAAAVTQLLEDPALVNAGLTVDVYDIIDTHLLHSVIDKIARGDFALSEEDYKEYTLLSESVSGLDVKGHRVSESWKCTAIASSEDASGETPLRSFRHPIFDKCFADFDMAMPVTSLETAEKDNTLVASPRGFVDSHHWHVLKELNKKHTEKADFWKLKNQQFYMDSMHKYAASLTGALGNMLEPKLIVAAEKPSHASSNKPKQKQPATNKKISKADEIRQKNTERMMKKGSKVDLFKNLMETNETTTVGDIVTSITNLERFNKNLDAMARAELEASISAYKLTLLWNLWILVTDGKLESERKAEDYDVVARMFHEIYDITRSKDPHPHIVLLAKKILKRLGFSNLKLGSASSSSKSKEQIPQELLELYAPLHTRYKITQSIEEFQLAHCGTYLDRNMDSAPDTRVPFEPDGWQREVLDEIDAGDGLLVVAPTSAGKTFISFYAMEKVLRESDDGVLVYVAPTKALVNQIAAEVQSRFKKNYKTGSTRTVWSIHTRDYRINEPTNCQILITVPHILQIMLLSPANATSWSPRVKRIIFDEVHSIGQSDEGVIWEQLLILSPCPVIALSATVGNPEEFGAWIASAQESIGVGFKTVVWEHRYSDLRKYIFNDRDAQDEKNGKRQLAQLDDSKFIKLLHPILAMANPSIAVLKDLMMEPRECLAVFNALQAINIDVPKQLRPQVFFNGLIKKADVIRWASELKLVIGDLIHKGCFQRFRDVLAKDYAQFVPAVVKVVQPTAVIELEEKDVSDTDENSDASSVPSDWMDEEAGEDDDVDEISRGLSTVALRDEVVESNMKAIQTTLPLLRTLQSQNALPALLFSYDRGICEQICETLVNQLESEEQEYRDSAKYKEKIKEWTAWKSSVADMEKNRKKVGEKKASKEKRTGKDQESKDQQRRHEQEEKEAHGAFSRWALFDPNDPDEGYTFASFRGSYPKSEFEVDMQTLSSAGIDPVFIRAFRRGVGVHHAGLSRKYREAVERLFRNGYLQVVIATGTLALGINMPCSTTAFIGDHLYLTPLNYQQSSGRAGRRGFDLVGNVVFHGINFDKITRLMTAKLPSLHGHFPITTSLVLRLFILLHGSKDSAFAKRAVEALLTQSRLYIGDGDNSFRGEVLHHLRFSIEFLQRHGLLDGRGVPLEFAGLTSHLYYTENASFAFHALLRRGVFHALCKDVGSKRKGTCKNLILVLSNIFCKRPLSRFQVSRLEEFKAEINRSPSIVILPKLDTWIDDILKEEDKLTLDIYASYVKSFTASHLADKPDHKLPFTGTVCGSSSSSGHYTATSVSSFVGLSSHADSYSSIDDLCSSVRSDIPLEAAAVPKLHNGEDVVLNAYLYDFYRHGALQPLVDANGIRKSDVWFALKDFSFILASIVTSLKLQLQLGEAEVDVDFDSAGIDSDEHFEEKEETEEEGGHTFFHDSAAYKDPKVWADVLHAFTVLKKDFDRKLARIGATKRPTGPNKKVRKPKLAKRYDDEERVMRKYGK